MERVQRGDLISAHRPRCAGSSNGRWRRSPSDGEFTADAWKADLTAHQNQMAGLGDDLAFEVGRIEDSIEIRAVLHLNQDDPRFGGQGNPNLSGEATSRSGDWVLVEAEASVEFPLDGPRPSSRSSRVPYDGLVTGESYRLSQETPLMPEREPADPLEALVKAVELPAGSVVRVIANEDQGAQPWYEVVLVGREKHNGLDQQPRAHWTTNRPRRITTSKNEPLHVHKTPVASSGRPVRSSRSWQV